MKYSIEDIYKYSGQFDKIVSVSFRPNSNAYKKFGQYVVGTFYYTPKERQILQKRIDNNENESNDGIVKLKVSGFQNLDNEQKDLLFYDGFLSSEIIEILQYNEPVENEFSKTSIRKLPDPINVKVDFSDTDEDEMFLWLNSSKLQNGYQLIPSEIHKYNGIILRKYENQIPSGDLEHFKNPDTGEIKDEIRYEYLKSKFFRDLLSDKEMKEFEERTKNISKERVSILKQELPKSSENWKRIGLNYNQGLNLLISLSIYFEPERLNAGKFPVWWDYERFLHIYIRHVSETRIGERFEEDKSVFQYKLNDINRLVKTIIKLIEKEIQEHFTNYPEKEFKRIGEMSIYYNGDYYALQIGTDGRLMRFHKN